MRDILTQPGSISICARAAYHIIMRESAYPALRPRTCTQCSLCLCSCSPPSSQQRGTNELYYEKLSGCACVLPPTLRQASPGGITTPFPTPKLSPKHSLREAPRPPSSPPSSTRLASRSAIAPAQRHRTR